MSDNRDERSLGELFRELSREILALMRQETHLAKAELYQKASKAQRDLALFALGGGAAFAGSLAILAAVAVALAKVMTLWLALLIVGLGSAFVGLVIIAFAVYRLREEDLKPQQTLETLKEDKQWLKDQLA